MNQTSFQFDMFGTEKISYHSGENKWLIGDLKGDVLYWELEKGHEVWLRIPIADDAETNVTHLLWMQTYKVAVFVH